MPQRECNQSIAEKRTRARELRMTLFFRITGSYGTVCRKPKGNGEIRNPEMRREKPRESLGNTGIANQ
jgi:hypothetical protein